MVKDIEKTKVIDSIERLKLKADLFLKKNIKSFIVDTYNNYYFCNLLVVGEDYLFVENFSGKKSGEKERILWYDILRLEEYKEEEWEGKK